MFCGTKLDKTLEFIVGVCHDNNCLIVACVDTHLVAACSYIRINQKLVPLHVLCILLLCDTMKE